MASNALIVSLRKALYVTSIESGERAYIESFGDNELKELQQLLKEGGINCSAAYFLKNRLEILNESGFENFMIQQDLPLRFTSRFRRFLGIFDYARQPDVEAGQRLHKDSERGALMEDFLKYGQLICNEWDIELRHSTTISERILDRMEGHLKGQGYNIFRTVSSIDILELGVTGHEHDHRRMRGQAEVPSYGRIIKERAPKFEGGDKAKSPADFVAEYYRFIYGYGAVKEGDNIEFRRRKAQESRLTELVQYQYNNLAAVRSTALG